MNKLIFKLLLCVVILFTAVALTACGNETNALQSQITALENDNAELQSTISSLRTELERSQADLSRTQNDLYTLQSELDAAEEQATQQDNQSGPLAITYGGEPNTDMTWPFSYGELSLGLRINLNELGEDDEIIWHSANEDIFTVVPGEDGLTATVTPITTGSAQLVVTVGNQETKSWVRIT